MTLFRQRVDLGCVFLAGLTGLLLARGPAPPAPEVEYNGCRTVSFPGPVCALWPARPPLKRSPLKLWVRVDPSAEVEIRADGERLEVAGEESQGGLRFKLQLPPRSLWLPVRLTVRLREREGQLSQPWSLALVPPRAPRWEEEIGKLQADSRKSAELRRRLAELRRGVPRDEWEYLFRPLANQAHADGHDDEAIRWLEQGMVVDHDKGLLNEEVDKTTRLTGIYTGGRRFAEARQALKKLKIPAGAPADSLYLVAYAQGLLADHLGDYGSALENLRQASGLAERGGMEGYELESGQVLARVLEELGRSKDAKDLFTGLNSFRSRIDGPCALGTFLTNEAWSQLLAREGGEKADDPTPTLREAKTLFDSACAPGQKLNARLNLALAAQQARQWPEAQQSLREAESPFLAVHANLDQGLWLLDLKGRLAIAEDDPRSALDLYGRLAAIAKETASIDGSFRAAVGRANAQQKLGLPEEALASFKEADRLIDEQTLHIPASDGRDTFVGQRVSAVRQYLQILLDLKRKKEALELVRRDRSRLLRQLEVKDRLTSMTPDQQQRWDTAMSQYWTLHALVDHEAVGEDLVPGDELKRRMEKQAKQLDAARKQLDRALADVGGSGNREESPLSPPSPGEIILTYHPLPEGWVGFAATPDGIDPQISFFDLPDDVLAEPGAVKFRAALALKLIGPFQEVLKRATRVRVLPFGPLRSVDFNVLPLDGKPLMDWLPVVYGLDVPARPSPVPAGRPVALLVADPEDNLPEARKESDDVDETIRRQGWTPKLLKGKEASARAVRDALPGTSLFEFAGHGELRGFGGWDSALRLADGSRLTSRDLLTLRVPAWVVLSTCEGGASSREAPGEGIGLAQAFLLAGSQAVVAAIRPVRDATAREFVAELHRRWKPGTDLVQPFSQAQRACLQRHADCASFRLLQP